MGFILFLAALAAAVLLAALYCYQICFHVPKQRHEDLFRQPAGEQYAEVAQRMAEISLIMESAECEWISLICHDQSRLWGRLYEFYPGAPVLVVFHGYRSMALRDCAGAFALGQKLGFNVLAVDQRCHGKSDGRVITFGIRERYDCLDWIRYITNRFGSDTPIVLSGISMGAATVLMASDLPLPDQVVGIMADCPYSSPEGIIRKVATDMHYPEKLAMPLVRLGARLYGGLNIRESSVLSSVKNAKIPILLVHGDDDRFIPWEMTQEIHENCKAISRFFTFPGAGHGLCYIKDPRRYEKICVDFLWNIPRLRPWLEKSEFVTSVRQA